VAAGKRWILLAAFAALAASPPSLAARRFFGHYQGQALVSTSPFYPPGVYGAEVMIAQTESGIVGYVNIAFDPGDFLGGIVTHAFSAPIAGGAPLLSLKYSDRMCGGGEPIDKCYPHAATNTQYSFAGQAAFYGTKLTLEQPSLLPDLPYGAVLPFDSIFLSRTPDLPRASFEGQYMKLDYIWMGTIFLPLPLPLLGSNRVFIEDGEIVEWYQNGIPIPVPGVVSAWCFDDDAGHGWMNQQGEWGYRWVLDPQGRGLGVITTFATAPPDCDDLQDPLAAGGLDATHKNLVGIMFEPAPPVVGPGAARGLRLSRDGGSLQLDWAPDCGTGTAYAIYRGDLLAGYDSLVPEPGSCSVATDEASIPLGDGPADFFLVVPNDGSAEGSYGIDAQGERRPPSSAACYGESLIDSCAP
jgi:hypothetical protein